MKKNIIKANNTFTLKEDLEIKKLLAIIRAVPKEKQISIKETLRINHGFDIKCIRIKGSTNTVTLEDYEKLKAKGIIKIKVK